MSANAGDENEFEALVDAAWRAIVAADVDPEQSHVELLFGSGGAPWDGAANRRATYFLTSHRTNDLVLLSFNACIALCSDDFPQCFRVNYDDPSDDVDDDDDDVAKNDADPGDVKQCGRRFPKTRDGVRQAALLAVDVHRRSAAADQAQWAVLVAHRRDGAFRRLRTWPLLADVFAAQTPVPRPRCAAPWWRVPLALFVASVTLVLLLALIAAASGSIHSAQQAMRAAPAIALKRGNSGAIDNVLAL